MNELKVPAQDAVGLEAGKGIRAGALAINEIVFATDFSLTSHVAGMYARALAEKFVVPLTVMHVFLLSQGASEAEAVSEHASRQREAVKDALEKLAHSSRPAIPQRLLCSAKESHRRR